MNYKTESDKETPLTASESEGDSTDLDTSQEEVTVHDQSDPHTEPAESPPEFPSFLLISDDSFTFHNLPAHIEGITLIHKKLGAASIADVVPVIDSVATQAIRYILCCVGTHDITGVPSYMIADHKQSLLDSLDKVWSAFEASRACKIAFCIPPPRAVFNENHIKFHKFLCHAFMDFNQKGGSTGHVRFDRLVLNARHNISEAKFMPDRYTLAYSVLDKCQSHLIKHLSAMCTTLAGMLYEHAPDLPDTHH